MKEETPVATKEQVKENAKKMFSFLQSAFEDEEFVEFVGLSFTKDGQVMTHTVSLGQTPLMTIVGALECQKMQTYAEIVRNQTFFNIEDTKHNYSEVDKPRGH